RPPAASRPGSTGSASTRPRSRICSVPSARIIGRSPGARSRALPRDRRRSSCRRNRSTRSKRPASGWTTSDPGVRSRAMKLSRAEGEQRIKGLAGWTLEGDAIRKQYTFKDSPEAVAFVNRLVPEAEAADHHPDIQINYKRVTLTYSTHSEGGLTVKDFEGGATADRLP